MTDTRSIVVDASIALGLLLREPSALAIRSRIDEWTVAGRELVVPSVFWLEVVNSLSRRHRRTGREVLQAVHEIDELVLTTIDIDRPLVVQTIDAVERFGLTAYDAQYLALANLLGADLATLDIELATAAGSKSIAVDGSRRVHEPPVVYEHEVTWPSYKEASAYLANLRADALAGSRRA